MTVAAQTPLVTFTGNGVTKAFAFPFRILASTDLQVYVNNVLTTTGFTVSGVGVSTGGTITFITAPAVGVSIKAQRVMELIRSTDYVEGGALKATVLDDDLDRIVMMVQDVSTETTSRLDSIDAFVTTFGAHSALSGLDADDHPQYLNNARGDSRYSAVGHSHTAAQVTDLNVTIVGTVNPLISSALSNASGVSVQPYSASLAQVAALTDANGFLRRTSGTWSLDTTVNAWGYITGSLASQTDLQAALDAKASLTYVNAQLQVQQAPDVFYQATQPSPTGRPFLWIDTSGTGLKVWVSDGL